MNLEELRRWLFLLLLSLLVLQVQVWGQSLEVGVMKCSGLRTAVEAGRGRHGEGSGRSWVCVSDAGLSQVRAYGNLELLSLRGVF